MDCSRKEEGMKSSYKIDGMSGDGSSFLLTSAPYMHQISAVRRPEERKVLLVFGT